MKKLLLQMKNTYDQIDRAYKHGYNRLLFSCRYMCQLSSEALDRKLAWNERLPRRIHLLLCQWCRRYNRQLRFLRKNLGYYAKVFPEKKASEYLSEIGRDRILQKIREKNQKNL